MLEEGGRRRAVVILQYLDIGQAGRIIDGDVDELPANATDAGASVAPDAVAHLTDSTKLLGVEMHKITWALADASANWFRRRQRTRSAKTEPAGSARIISTCGATRRKNRPTPVSVPPEPTPQTTASRS